MKQHYNHNTHSYEYRPTHHAVVERLGNMRGVHNDKVANAQPSGIFVYALVIFLAFAWFTKAEATAEPVCLFHVAGLCL